ncbi:flagellar hook-length control protein FliK [Niveibacterium terrae]|uniref:flagellar hook-length control protein FliK n=1 Tax=Niveibacterium terrae TaxID=3373598 RepID=UPI003A933459
MIPSDLYSRLRILLDTPLPEVAPVARTHAVQNLEFANGQRFTAQILNPLPDGTFKALVAGRTVTLSLPESVKSGDVLELVVSRATPQAVFAQQLQPSTEATPKPQLSPTAQLFSQMISGRLGEADPAPLNRGTPMLPQAPVTAAQISQIAANLAPALAKAVGQSGLFYESHQAQWVDGERTLESLKAEPQGQLSIAAKNAAAAHPQLVSQRPQTQTMDAERSAQSPSPIRGGESNVVTQTVPREVQSLVHQQLESLVSQQLVWQGQVWPGQTMEWRVDVPEREGSGREELEPQNWHTSLRLALPDLGELDAELILNASGVAIRINAASADAAARLQQALPDLADALAAAGVPLTGSAIAASESAR